jgi:signal transduction histidine kinase
LKHAWASEVRFSLDVSRDILSLRISDNGNGFDPRPAQLSSSDGQPARNGGHGLVNMRQRVETLGGQWNLKTAPGQGTSITVHIPIQSFRTKPK